MARFSPPQPARGPNRPKTHRSACISPLHFGSPRHSMGTFSWLITLPPSGNTRKLAPPPWHVKIRRRVLTVVISPIPQARVEPPTTDTAVGLNPVRRAKFACLNNFLDVARYTRHFRATFAPIISADEPRPAPHFAPHAAALPSATVAHRRRLSRVTPLSKTNQHIQHNHR